MLTKPRLLTPGPTQLPDRVRLAMAADMIHHRKPEFKKIMAEVQEGLQELFGTTEPVLPLTSSGTGAMSAAVSALFQPGETVLVIEAGRFSERWTEIAKACDVQTRVLSFPWGSAASPEAIARELDAYPEIAGVLVQLSETSTGVQHPIKEIATITRNRPALLVVDGISGVSITPCPMDAWGVDCLVTGSQKGIMLPPGLAFIACSQRAWKKAERVPCKNFYFNLLAERENIQKKQTNFTPAIGLIMGLKESLAMFKEFGLHAIYQKQWALTQMARVGIEAMGLPLFAKTHFAWGLTSVLLPEPIDASSLLAIAQSRFGVIMAAGQGHFKNRMVRIGHMGWVDYADLAAGLHAFAKSYETCGGFIGCRDYLEQALDAYWTHLDNPITVR